MRRHDLDLTSLVAGLVLLALAAAYVVGAYTDVRLDGRYLLPGALVLIGAAGLVGSASASRRSAARAAAGGGRDLRESDLP